MFDGSGNAKLGLTPVVCVKIFWVTLRRSVIRAPTINPYFTRYCTAGRLTVNEAFRLRQLCVVFPLRKNGAVLVDQELQHCARHSIRAKLGH